jgi:hypothetical protein
VNGVAWGDRRLTFNRERGIMVAVKCRYVFISRKENLGEKENF